jgi:adenylate cyclase
MKYRTKLYIALVATAVVSTALSLGIAYYQVKKFFLEELRSQVMSVAASAATTIDGDLLKTIDSPKDQNSKAYKVIQDQLREIRDANRRHDVYIKFVYTVQPKPNDPHGFNFQVDAEEDTPDFSHYGDDVPDAKDDQLSANYQRIYSPAHFIYNKWGIWMTGFAPIYDSKGKYVATVAADLGVSDVVEKLNRLVSYGIFSFVAAVILSLLAAYFLSKQETISLKTLSEGVEEIGSGNLNTRIYLNGHDEFDELANSINDMAQGLQERERLRLNFTRYVSQHIMETIIKTETPVKLEGERRRVTLLFSDIRQFTQLSETLSPEDVVSLLNEYFGIMVEIIFKNHGTLDKFIGDGMMIEFGVPVDDHRQEYHAVQTAIEMQQALKELCKKWEKEGKPLIDVGIGVHSGIAIVGNIGSERRIEYTAIGDTVNVAARLEQLTKDLKVPIVISETTVEPIKKDFTFKNLGPVHLRGRADAIVVYTVMFNDK